ncbi:MAG: AMP-binding protein [Alistipes sp.]|jgi:phenylacetate-CoA ligase|nr:AMP-binding protein [Alistipes sp.]
MNRTHDPEIQYAPPAEIERCQSARLVGTMDYVAANSPYYRRLFAAHDIDPATIRTLEDLTRLPVTTKEDLQLHGPDFVCVPPEKIADYVTTSGTLGDPVTFALTDADLDRLARNEALSFFTAGCAEGDILQLMTTIDRRFMAGLAYFLGARRLGIGVVRVGNGIPELQWDTIRRIQPTTCIAVPSFLIKLIEFAEANGMDYRASSLRRAVCIGESLRDGNFELNTLGRQIHDKWPELDLRSTYASTEMQTSFTECACHRGGHLQPELIVVELLDGDDRPVTPGTPGEVTITTLGVEGMPLVRFKTGDICVGYHDRCGCGRTTMRLGPVFGRKGQMIKLKGTTLYPPAMFDVLDSVAEIDNYIVEVSSNDLGTDSVAVRIHSSDRSDEFVKRLKDIFRARIRVAPEVIFDSADRIAHIQMPPMSRKPRKIVIFA